MSYCEERPEMYTERFPRARKEHSCCECNAPILPGEAHLYVKGRSEGEFWTVRQHMLCRELCMLMAETDGECFCFGEMREMWTEGDYHLRDPEPGPYAKARRLYAQVIRRERASRFAAARLTALPQAGPLEPPEGE